LSLSSSLKLPRRIAQGQFSRLGATIPVRALPDLTEIDFGSVAEGQLVKSWRPAMAATYSAWALGDWKARMLSNGETGQEVRAHVCLSRPCFRHGETSLSYQVLCLAVSLKFSFLS
jgi:broad specificity phosphatase PhoE